MGNNGMFEIFIAKAGSIPGIKIDREDFLYKTFKRKCRNSASVEKIVQKGPITAGVPMHEIGKIADQIIIQEATTTSVISFVTGIPGGFAMLGTIPADLAQFYARILIVVQKLMYLYGWEEDIFDSEGNLDAETEIALIAYIGAMFGVNAAGKVLKQVTINFAKQGIRNVAPKAAWKGVHKFLTNSVFRNLITKIVKTIGLKSVPKLVKNGVVKGIPVLGGVVSGVTTYPMFVVMTKRLKKFFESGDTGEFEYEDGEE